MSYRIQRLDGYTNGKPCWVIYHPKHFPTDVQAKLAAMEMKRATPTLELRVRHIKRRK